MSIGPQTVKLFMVATEGSELKWYSEVLMNAIAAGIGLSNKSWTHFGSGKLMNYELKERDEKSENIITTFSMKFNFFIYFVSIHSFTDL